MIRILICDDHPIINQGIESCFASHHEMRVVATANTAAKLRALLATTRADVLLLDINLPDDSGIELCAEINKSYPELK
ncbi:MAG: response regulator transcription factor, partial [Bacteroidia bacterium]|nr:response regulator transcription factor [Bacteroidia bacterium]